MLGFMEFREIDAVDVRLCAVSRQGTVVVVGAAHGRETRAKVLG